MKLFDLDLSQYSLCELRFLKDRMDLGCDKPEPEQVQFYEYFMAPASVVRELELERFVDPVFRRALP